jgi:lipoprotein-anchoring transpeptidase ErfK/SrfK
MIGRLSGIVLFVGFIAFPGAPFANPAFSGADVYGPGSVADQSPVGGGLIGALFGSSGRIRDDAPPAMGVGTGVVAYASPAESLGRAVDPIYMRTEVAYDGPGAPGSIVIDTPNKFLYFIEGRGRAIRYGVGVGRPGFEWSGVKTVSRKAEWPDWTPPADMLLRRPDLPRHMPGGPANPLGARALYLGSSLYRIHGTNEPDTIGRNVSSGCIRMMNADVIDLYNRVHVGAPVVIR